MCGNCRQFRRRIAENYRPSGMEGAIFAWLFIAGLTFVAVGVILIWSA